MNTLSFTRPMSCELAEASILAEHEQHQARVIREYEHRAPEREPRELVRFASRLSNVGLITDVASDLERAGFTVSLRWIRDDSGLIIGIALVQP
jgi:hypothetical protein